MVACVCCHIVLAIGCFAGANTCDPTGKQQGVFLAWVAAVLTSDAAVVIHEGIPQLWIALHAQHRGMHCHIYRIMLNCTGPGSNGTNAPI